MQQCRKWQNLSSLSYAELRKHCIETGHARQAFDPLIAWCCPCSQEIGHISVKRDKFRKRTGFRPHKSISHPQ